MTPEKIEEARRRAKDFLAFHEPCRHEGGCLACRRAYDYLALLAEWEERGREIERLRASTLPDVVPEDADALKAEIERSHKAILALTGEIERLKDEYTQILIHQDTFQQAEVERLKNEIAWQEERNANNVMAYTEEIKRLKRELDGANIGMQIREKALEQAEARLARVMEIVRRIHVSDHGYCAGCGGEWVSSNEWPCETLREVEAV